MNSPYILHFAPDNASLIVRLALEELNLPYRTVLVDRATSDQRSPRYLALNPAGRIPTLETPDGPISETAAILIWLGDRHGGLIPPPESAARAPYLNWLLFVSNTLHADMIQLFYVHRYGPETAWPDIRAAARKRITRSLEVLETRARPRLAGWFCEDRPTALDLYVAAILRWLRIYPGDAAMPAGPAPLPHLSAIGARLESRSSVAALCAAEGLGTHPFTRPRLPDPPEGTAV